METVEQTGTVVRATLFKFMPVRCYCVRFPVMTEIKIFGGNGASCCC